MQNICGIGELCLAWFVGGSTQRVQLLSKTLEFGAKPKYKKHSPGSNKGKPFDSLNRPTRLPLLPSVPIKVILCGLVQLQVVLIEAYNDTNKLAFYLPCVQHLSQIKMVWIQPTSAILM